MQTSPEPLNPAAGGINCIVAERPASHTAHKATLGRSTQVELTRLAHDVGAAIVQVATESGGTVELQITRCEKVDALKGITVHQVRVDIWKARQRQFLRVPVRSAMATMGDAKQAVPPTAVAHYGIVPLFEGQKLGEFLCPHCAQPHAVAPFSALKLPRVVVLNCSRCTLPMHARLVDVEGGK